MESWRPGWFDQAHLIHDFKTITLDIQRGTS